MAGGSLASAGRLLRLWPEAVLAAVTVWLVWLDGLRTSSGDPAYYLQIAGQVSQGQVPYRDFPFEYPPVSLPPILLPYFLPNGSSWEWFSRYLFAENVLMLIGIGIGVAWLAARGWSHVPRLRAAVTYSFLALALAPAVVWRYDALPTLLTVLAVVAVAHGRPILSGVALGTAIVGKLYPLAMLPALTLGQVRGRRLRPAVLLVGATVLTAVLIVVPFVIVGGAGAFSFLEYAIERGVQIESVPGALALLADVLGGPEAQIFHGFGTFQVDSPLIRPLASLTTLATVLLVAALGLALWHRFRVERRTDDGLLPSTQVTHLLAALMVALVSSRILSPQYLIWVVPFVALASRPKALVFWVACLLTTFVYPLHYYDDFLAKAPYTVWAVNIRNAILFGFTVWVIWPDLRSALAGIAARRGGGSASTAPSG